MPQSPFLICKLRVAILNFPLMPLLFFKSIVRNEFPTPKYPIIEVLIMPVGLQDQFLHADPFSIFAHLHNLLNMLIKKIAQSCRSGNKAKFAYLPTQNTNP